MRNFIKNRTYLYQKLRRSFIFFSLITITIKAYPAELTPFIAQQIKSSSADKTSIIVIFKNPRKGPLNANGAGKNAPAFASVRPSPQAVFSATESNEVVDLWLVNGYAVSSSHETLKKLSENPNVAHIVENFTVTLPKVQTNGYVSNQSATPWGLENMGATQAWEAFNATGRGIRIGHLDTGIDPNHPDLKGKIASWAEFDSFGNKIPSSVPHDSSYHGTHTAGVIVGGSASGHPIGVAPDAKLISALVLNGANGTLSQVISGMQWILDPDGNPQTDDGAHILSMSLGAPGQYSIFQTLVDELLAAGVLPIFAIGNRGAGNTDSPGNTFGSIAVGASSSSDSIAFFSGGGEVTLDNKTFIKPEMAAPGYGIKSSVPGGLYQNLSGTSMATPHVAGAAALLMEKRPDLSIQEIKNLLLQSALDIDEPGLDARSGSGRLDILAALTTLMDESVVRGRIQNGEGPIPGLVQIRDSSGKTIKTARADAETGQFYFSIPVGKYTAVASFGLAKGSQQTFQIEKGTIINLTFNINASTNQLDNMAVYPNPFRPKEGHQEVLFDGLPPDTKIAIYSMSGTFIKELSGSTDGQYSWRAQNTYNEDIASGLYLYLARYYDPNGGWKHKQGKMVIIR